MTQDEQICSLALTRIPGLGLTGAFRLVSSLGSATRVFEHRKELSQLVPGVSEKIITALNNSEAFRRAEQELTFCEKNHIRCLTLNDEGYPGRLRECDDAPLAFFYRGTADLNALHVINMVGTRHATPYGQDICCLLYTSQCLHRLNSRLRSLFLAHAILVHIHRLGDILSLIHISIFPYPINAIFIITNVISATKIAFGLSLIHIYIYLGSRLR